MVCKRKCNLWLSVCFVRCAINWINFREWVKMTKKKRQHKRNHSQQTKKTFDVTGWREIGFQLLIWIFIFVFHIISIFVATEQTIHSMWVMNTKRTCCFWYMISKWLKCSRSFVFNFFGTKVISVRILCIESGLFAVFIAFWKMNSLYLLAAAVVVVAIWERENWTISVDFCLFVSIPCVSFSISIWY